MNKLRHITGGLILILFICWSLTPAPAMAQEDNPVQNILLDTFYGLVTGALVGTAISAPQDDPDWQQNIGSGAAIGAIAGLVFGVIYEGKPLVTESKAVIDMEKSQVKIQIPSLQTSAEQDEDRQKQQTNYSVELLSYHF